MEDSYRNKKTKTDAKRLHAVDHVISPNDDDE